MCREKSVTPNTSSGAGGGAAAHLWLDDDWLFANPFGQSINPRTDYDDWKALLTRAGVRDARLHDARHTAATVLLILGVPERAVMSIMGWSNTAMALLVTSTSRRRSSRTSPPRVGGLIWQREPPG